MCEFEVNNVTNKWRLAHSNYELINCTAEQSFLIFYQKKILETETSALFLLFNVLSMVQICLGYYYLNGRHYSLWN